MVDLISVKLHSRRDIGDFAVDTSIEVALLLKLLEQFSIVALTSLNYGRQQSNLATREALLDQLDNALIGVVHHLLTRHGRVGTRRASIQQTQKIVDLGNRTHRRTRILIGGLLLDRNHRTQSRNLIDIRAFHIADELAGIGRQRLHIAALTLGIDRIEGQ